jgi:hypothetical protein
MPAFDYYKPLAQDPNAQANYGKAQAEQQYYLNKQGQARNAAIQGISPWSGSTFESARAGQDMADASRGLARTGSAMQANAGPDEAALAKDKALGLTAGVSDRIMNDPQVAAALAQLESGMKSGPYTPEIQQQIVNRNADQTAVAESVNADEFRNQAAARGMSASDPAYQAQLRQGQSQRQQQNVAFQGDMGTRAALENYGAQQNAARGLASGRLSQYGQAQPGYMQAANWTANEQFNGGRAPAVTSGGQPAFSQQPQGSQANPFAAFSQQHPVQSQQNTGWQPGMGIGGKQQPATYTPRNSPHIAQPQTSPSVNAPGYSNYAPSKPAQSFNAESYFMNPFGVASFGKPTQKPATQPAFNFKPYNPQGEGQY